MSRRTTTRLCGEPGCREVGVDVAGGWRCEAHRRSPWDKWRAARPSGPAYGARWRRLKATIVRERGSSCEACGAQDVPLELHHLDRQGMTGPRAYDERNLVLLCVPCHRRASRRARAS
jgi:5-methylcytosine-specific restriction endonuclease McrA